MPARHIAIIPARKNSKSIKNKNLLRLDASSKTLTRIAVEKALESKIFSHVLLSTDISKMNINLDGLTHPSAMTRFEYIGRPASLCQDETPMMDVMRHAMEYLGNAYEYVWLLQPTSPFRRKEDFKLIKRAVEDGYYNSVISYKPVSEHPSRMYTMGEGQDKKTKAYPLNKKTNYENKQELGEVYIRSGNYYVTKRELLLEYNTFENRPIYPFGVTRMKGTNLDCEEDLALAKHWINRGSIKL